MSDFALLHPHEVIERWPALRDLLSKAVEQSNGELSVDDIRTLVLGGKMFIFASEGFALTCEFIVYPKRTVMIVGFGAGTVPERDNVAMRLKDFARRGGAVAIQTYCKNPAMTRYYRRWFNLEPTYTLLETPV